MRLHCAINSHLSVYGWWPCKWCLANAMHMFYTHIFFRIIIIVICGRCTRRYNLSKYAGFDFMFRISICVGGDGGGAAAFLPLYFNHEYVQCKILKCAFFRAKGFSIIIILFFRPLLTGQRRYTHRYNHHGLMSAAPLS